MTFAARFGKFPPVKAFEPTTLRFLLWLGGVLSILVAGQFLLHPPTEWMIRNISVPSVLAVVAVAVAGRAGRRGRLRLALLIAVLWGLFQVVRTTHHLRRLPPAINVASVVALGASSLRGCGAAVFGLAPPMVKALRSVGSEALPSLDHPFNHFDAWQATPTPADGNQRWASGLECGLSQARSRDIFAAMRRGGGFYAKKHWTGGAAILLFPKEQLAVFTYSGD